MNIEKALDSNGILLTVTTDVSMSDLCNIISKEEYKKIIKKNLAEKLTNELMKSNCILFTKKENDDNIRFFARLKVIPNQK